MNDGGCGATRTVSLEQALRIEKGKCTGLCASCKNPPRIMVREDHRRYWLIMAGVPEMTVSRAGGAAGYVRAHGLPAPLQPIAASAAFLRR